MLAWTAPDVPSLPGSGALPSVYDTATGQLRTIPEGAERVVRMYVCGITPYDATHIGHAATYVTFDVLNRAWRDAGLEVRYVQNVTDVDDPLLERAAVTGVDWAELAQEQTELFRADMAALRVLPPTHFVGAVEAIPLIAELIQRLEVRGATYQVDGDVYFRVDTDPAFGVVSGLDRVQMWKLFAERGGDPERPGKKDPLDCLLWQQQRPGEPAWTTALGHGRPGWHIECAAIALHYLGDSFDVQGGGTDLVFPHHEMSAAEARVVTGTTAFARAYVHRALIAFDGAKMSKSRGNLVFVSALRDLGVDPMAVRLALLARHYREGWEWSDTPLAEAVGRLERWRAAVRQPAGPDGSIVTGKVRAALAADLDTPAALDAVDRWAEAALAGDGTHSDAQQCIRRAVDALLGVAL